ncbi:hypothetical protein F5Y16DRAFT_411342 [Xylariaceae sp. FL0255]|nr:hypothetical protein F5Y16DRAFT_411342 [Xylariaceae sp. FL0255]
MSLNPQSGAHGFTSSSSNGNTTPKSPNHHYMLPNKAVTSATIEDAYVSFIFYCNPAVSRDIDTTTLREAFRTPPKSEGKSFSTFTLFQLIAKLHQKEIKTWAELALKLGVEPPDHEKGQSSQKIQQYAVRLKRWMHSMHVNAFFDYLLDNPHPYWTQIPTDGNPVCEDGRDGVAAEDDMALRALLPHIRPRRGRKRPDDDNLTKSPSQKPRLNSPAFNGDIQQHRPEDHTAWSAHPDSRQTYGYPPVDPRSAVLPGPDPVYGWQNEMPREAISAYPHSAITPNTRGAFWPDAPEPQSAVSPKSKPMGRRHGAKAVSSAWRSIGVSASGKARGRPPINRGNETPLSAYPPDTRSLPSHNMGFDQPSPTATPRLAPMIQQPPEQDNNDQLYKTPRIPPLPRHVQESPQLSPATTPVLAPTPQPVPEQPASEALPEPGSRSRPGRLSLQVPERAGGTVRLATPPPPQLTVNGQSNDESNAQEPEDQEAGGNSGQFSMFDREKSLYRNPGESGDKMTLDGPNKANHDDIEAVLVTTLISADWLEPNGSIGPRPCIGEVLAVVRAVIRGLTRSALTKEAFLINLAALVGGHFMIKDDRKVTRAEYGQDWTRYVCSWSLQYGTIVGAFNLSETVPHAKWKAVNRGPDYQHRPEDLEDLQPTEGTPAAEYWKQQYTNLAVTSIKRLNGLMAARVHSLKVLKEAPDVDIHRPV